MNAAAGPRRCASSGRSRVPASIARMRPRSGRRQAIAARPRPAADCADVMADQAVAEAAEAARGQPGCRPRSPARIRCRSRAERLFRLAELIAQRAGRRSTITLAWTMMAAARPAYAGRRRGSGRRCRPRLQPPERRRRAPGPWSSGRNSWGCGRWRPARSPARPARPAAAASASPIDRRGEILVFQIDQCAWRRRSRASVSAPIRSTSAVAAPGRLGAGEADARPRSMSGASSSRPGIAGSASCGGRRARRWRARQRSRARSPSASAAAPSTIAITSCRGGMARAARRRPAIDPSSEMGGGVPAVDAEIGAAAEGDAIVDDHHLLMVAAASGHGVVELRNLIGVPVEPAARPVREESWVSAMGRPSARSVYGCPVRAARARGRSACGRSGPAHGPPPGHPAQAACADRTPSRAGGSSVGRRPGPRARLKNRPGRRSERPRDGPFRSASRFRLVRAAPSSRPRSAADLRSFPALWPGAARAT